MAAYEPSGGRQHMSDSRDRECVEGLVAEAIQICDRIGEGVAASHLQLGLDTLAAAKWVECLDERRRPWRKLN